MYLFLHGIIDPTEPGLEEKVSVRRLSLLLLAVSAGEADEGT